MTPSEAPNVERVMADLDKLRLRLIDRGEYVTNEWADVADASLIGEALEALRELLAVREASAYTDEEREALVAGSVALAQLAGYHNPASLAEYVMREQGHILCRLATTRNEPPRKETT